MKYFYHLMHKILCQLILDAISSRSSGEKQLIQVIEILNDLNTRINNNEILDEFTYEKNYANAEQIEIWKQSALNSDTKWVEMFKILRNEKYSLKNILKLIDFFAFALLASNAVAERVLLIFNNIWSAESLLITKYNFEIDCSEFGKHFNLTDPILKKKNTSCREILEVNLRKVYSYFYILKAFKKRKNNCSKL